MPTEVKDPIADEIREGIADALADFPDLAPEVVTMFRHAYRFGFLSGVAWERTVVELERLETATS